MSGRPDRTPKVVAEGSTLWEPSPDRLAGARTTAFMSWLERERGVSISGYPELWRWSVDHLADFWTAIWEHFEVPWSGTLTPALVRGTGAEGATWFPGAELNYVEQVLRQDPDAEALICCTEERAPQRLTYRELAALSGAVASGLTRLGVRRGDRVAAVLGNGSETVAAFLACASIGAIWSACAPEFGTQAMVDRFRQIEPAVLIVAASYRHRGRDFDLSSKIAEVQGELPDLAATVVVGGGAPGARRPDGKGPALRLTWDELAAEEAGLAPVAVPFAHPLWILFSSGTTGLPKPIVHGHGGIVLEHVKALALHGDLGPGDRFFWYTTTGWMMWNYLVGGLLVGATALCYDGDPMWPGPERLWRLAAETRMTYFGTSAPYIEACMRAGVRPRDEPGLAVSTIGSTGAPLSPEGFAWAAREIGDDVLVGSISGGTDVCTAFLTSCPLLPVRAGELQCRALAAKVEAFDTTGNAVEGEVGELVITEPMPSMPVRLWGDEDGSRLHASYFAHFPGAWRHGDWVKITPGGGAVVYGRSDATLNRGGVRMGTAEFYRALEPMPEIADALVVDTSELGREGELVLFVVAGTGGPIDEGAVARIRAALRARLSPRHVPDRIVPVPAIPRTINGKKIEVPIRRILLGVRPEDALSEGAIGDPGALADLLAAARAEGLV